MKRKTCICGRVFIDKSTYGSRRYCKKCEDISKRRRIPVNKLRGGKDE